METELLHKARNYDESMYDNARGTRDEVVLQSPGSHQPTFSASLAGESYNLKSEISDYGYSEKVSITKEGGRTVYQFSERPNMRNFHGTYSVAKSVDFPKTGPVKLIKKESDQGTELTLIEGETRITLHNLGESLGRILSGIPKVSIRR